MSCKGLVELIVLNIGLNAGILNTQVFSMFVVMALVTTCATTPLTQLIYPPHHRTPFKPGSIHSRKDEQTEKGPDGAHQRTIDSVSRKRFLVVLDRFDHLPGLLSFLQLLRPSVTSGGEDSSSLRHRRPDASADKAMSTSGSSNNHSSVDADNVPVLLSQSHAPHATHIDAVRMIELTERTSAVMRVAETDDTLRADPLINVFRTFASLNKLPVTATMNVVDLDEFSSVIVNRAHEEGANLVVVPWTLPTLASVQGGSSSNAFLNPMEGFFGTPSNTETSRHYQAAIVRKVIQTSPCDVGLLLDRNQGGSSLSAFYPHVILGFMGGPDDRCALSFVLRMCRANEEVKVTVFRYKKVEGGEELKSPQNTFHHTDSLRPAAMTNMVQDTMYPHSAGFTPLQAQLEDDLAISSVEEELAAGSTSTLAARFVIHDVVTPTPLHDFVSVVDKNRETSLIVLGRNRRLPTITHRAELRQLLNATEKDEKVLNSETCTVIGEVGTAVSRSCTSNAPILIIASALSAAKHSA